MKTTTTGNKFAVCSLYFAKHIRDAAFVLLVAHFLLPLSTSAQVGDWTWLKGPKVSNTLANYGTRTIPNAANNPPGLYEACQWTDTSGNFWLFGGVDFEQNKYGDLWKYNPKTNVWTWMNGTATTNDPGYYGVRGVPSLGNIPPARSHGMATWTDKNNNLWFFGGSQNLSLSFNDLWKYDIANNEWTWMKGPDTVSNPGVYGTQGVPDTANLPPHRHETVATWVDSSGDLWLFGGFSYPEYYVYNDLWRFNIATNTWTWMKGSNLPNDPGNFGTQKIESASTLPPSRATYAHLKDKHENLWIFGGFDSQQNFLNDIWRYNPVTNNWAWLSGSQTPNTGGVYGTMCIADSNNIPGARMENRACWTDNRGNLWFFGGFTNPLSSSASNELWKYCIESNRWTLVNGDTIPNPTGNWGTINVPSANNKPDGRGGSVSWIDTVANDLYMFGGTLDQNLVQERGDLWRFAIDTTCGPCAAAIPPVANFQVSDSSICANDCVTYSDKSTGATSWIWSFPGGLPSSSTDQNPFVCYVTSGVYDVTLIATSYVGSNKITITHYVTVNPAPPTPVISVFHGDTLSCSTNPDYVSYQWFDDTTLIHGATDTLLIISHSGNYNVKVIGSDGCSIAVGINVVGIEEFTVDGLQFTVWPNPTGNELILSGSSKLETGNWKINIFNVLGESIYSQQLQTRNPKFKTVLNVSGLSSGVYFIQLSNENNSRIGRFVKE